MMKIRTGLYALVIVFLCGCGMPEKQSKLKLIIDADTANEIDDLFAIAKAVAEPRFELIGITSAQFHISPLATDSSVFESQRLNEKILDAMNAEHIPAIIGSNQALSSSSEPNISEASDFIIEQALMHNDSQPLHIVILGPCTNVASAIMQEPAIISKIKVHYLGIWHDPAKNTYDKKEFNSGNDTLAVEILMNIPDLDFEIMSATTSQHLVFTKIESERNLDRKTALGHLLMHRWDTYHRWFSTEDSEKTEWIMWDIAIVQALARPDLAKKEAFMAPPENFQKQIDIYTEINVNEMKDDFWKALKPYGTP